MVKNNSGKKITIDGLAKMIKEGFDKTATIEQLDGVEERLGDKISGIEKDIKALRQQVAGAIFRSEFDGLESRVEYLENILNLPAKKH